jgi:hypothetical protein
MQKTTERNSLLTSSNFLLGTIIRALQKGLETIKSSDQQLPDNWYK